MLDKAKQLELAKEEINKQAKELVEVYGWKPGIIATKKQELLTQAEKEVNFYGEFEDLTGCWSLISWISPLNTCLHHDLDALETLDTLKESKDELIGLAYDITDKFKYIPNWPLEQEKVDTYAVVHNTVPTFVVNINNKFLRFNLMELKGKDPFKIANKIIEAAV